MESVSVIITAYNAQDFIKGCLDSVARQTYFSRPVFYEILLGIDNCKETLEKVLSIKDRYKNLKVFMMKENYGTYVVSNTLVDNSRCDYILRFDSDDVMKVGMIKTLMSHDSDIIRMRYSTFGKVVKHPNRFSWGQALFRREVFDACGGYEPWRCAADKELLNRAALKFKIKKIEDRLFYKRMHRKALTKAGATGRKSDVRREAHKKLKYNSSNRILKIKRVTGEYINYN